MEMDDTQSPDGPQINKFETQGEATISLHELAVRTRVPKDDIAKVFDAIVGFLSDGVNVRIPGFGKFLSMYRPPTPYRTHLAAGVTAPRRRVKFKISPTLAKQWADRIKAKGGVSIVEMVNGDYRPEEKNYGREYRHGSVIQRKRKNEDG